MQINLLPFNFKPLILTEKLLSSTTFVSRTVLIGSEFIHQRLNLSLQKSSGNELTFFVCFSDCKILINLFL